MNEQAASRALSVRLCEVRWNGSLQTLIYSIESMTYAIRNCGKLPQFTAKCSRARAARAVAAGEDDPGSTDCLGSHTYVKAKPRATSQDR